MQLGVCQIPLLLASILYPAANGLMSIEIFPLQAPASQKCMTLQNTVGQCSAHCSLSAKKQDVSCCVLGNRNVGVCCPQGSGGKGPPVWWKPAGNLPAVGNELDTHGGESTPPSKPNTPPQKPATTTARPQTTTPGKQDDTRRGCGLSQKKEFVRVVGGRPADPEQWPWMAAIMREKDIQFCGGCLITEQHILTAAHCVHQYKPSEVWVRLGEHDFSRADETRTTDMRVVDIRIHDNYDRDTYENDIAILKMRTPVRFNSYVWPVCLPEWGAEYENASAVVAGWGAVEYGGQVSDVLLEVSVSVWRNDLCENEYLQPIMDTNLCAGGVVDQDSCQGDSGGPLVFQLPNRRWVSIGIVSWGIRCGEGRPAVYTKVSRFIHWIINNAI